ncbi:hypothetical protein J2X46_004425 [Nocardioides sp. BE266]|uniref:hypothetical protein n=1 Tax=Nocardioides sp. BE266 TaxID=2817725 RepID=UPI00285998E7|nr:hypothetical protein [Nocardioides sp. BE266]MDR7255418.1 hypothetical protein [Nocardioides sp. BE266]
MTHPDALLGRLVGGDPAAADQVRTAAADTRSVPVLVAAAVVTGSVEPLHRAAGLATTTRDRQLVALAEARLTAGDDVFDALVRDHLADYPDQLLAAWMAAREH